MAFCLRWGSGRFIALAVFFLFTFITLLYTRTSERIPISSYINQDSFKLELESSNEVLENIKEYEETNCEIIKEAKADIDTSLRLQQFDFQPYWMKSREYWDTNFEKRYKDRRREWGKLPLKVIAVPHSHNDPGWLKTFENYYHYQTRNILNSMVDKLAVLKNMTFIWSEISFLSLWWQSVHPTKKRLVKKLIDEGRLEITTGGWVMTDEANAHVFAMVDQLIEGHQWVKNKLGVEPKSGWSIDPFGHGATVPYLLKESGVSDGTVIQRIHYAWKQWLAQEMAGDFYWRQSWDQEGSSDMLVHNLPFDIYSIKHSCGPHPQVCLNFDFRKVSGEYTEYSLRAVSIDEDNVRQRAELLLEQYGRTGSLFHHNVVLMPIGDDFRYDREEEWEQQYTNYKRLFDYINSHNYNAEVIFGTPKDYFEEIKKRTKNFPTLKGDFFVYSDIFSEGRPAYWSGYFTTRPYWKLLSRELEANLRSAEILYTLSLEKVRRLGRNNTLKIVERDYDKLEAARQSLGLFQHHDAITGTSKSAVMHDYALRLFDAIQETISIQGYALQMLLSKSEQNLSTRIIIPESERESYENLPEKQTINIDKTRKLIIFNSLAQHRQEIIRVRINSLNVRVLDSESKLVVSQINPIWNSTFVVDGYVGHSPLLTPMNNVFELIFIAELAPLSINSFFLDKEKKAERATVYCKNCFKKGIFPANNIQRGDVQLENQMFRLLIGADGFLKTVLQKKIGKVSQCSIHFAAYPSAQFHSGAYLFMPDPNSRQTEKDILEDYSNKKIIITSGPVSSRLTVSYGNFLAHSIEIFHTEGALGQAIYVENLVDFETPPKNRETELFMRIVTDINNGEPPEFYTDQNGFQTQKRVKIERIGIEGNYYPITTHAYVEDNEKRLSILVDHATGSASWEPGWLEVMIDRRTLYDDSRGMGEGVVDNKETLHKYWIIVESDFNREGYSTPTILSNQLSLSLLYPANMFLLDLQPNSGQLHKTINFLSKPFPYDLHLMNLRTMQDPTYDNFPTSNALLVLHRLGSSCKKSKKRLTTNNLPILSGTNFINTKINLTSVSLTGLKQYKHLDSLSQIKIKPMQIASFNVTFL